MRPTGNIVAMAYALRRMTELIGHLKASMPGSNRGCSSAIVIEDDDHVYIAYQNRDSSKLKIVTGQERAMGRLHRQITETPQATFTLVIMTSMVVGRQGQFHIAHYEDKTTI